MGRIEAAFSKAKRDGKKGFIPFITAGDPDLAATGELLVELSQSGVTVIELGVPFSDPMADGPVIQRASERALKHGFGLPAIFETTSSGVSICERTLAVVSNMDLVCRRFLKLPRGCVRKWIHRSCSSVTSIR